MIVKLHRFLQKQKQMKRQRRKQSIEPLNTCDIIRKWLTQYIKWMLGYVRHKILPHFKLGQHCFCLCGRFTGDCLYFQTEWSNFKGTSCSQFLVVSQQEVTVRFVVNQCQVNVTFIRKSVDWFALQISRLVSIWVKALAEHGLTNLFQHSGSMQTEKSIKLLETGNLFDLLYHAKGFYWKGGFDCIVNAAAKNNMNCLLLMRNTKAYSGIYQTRKMELFEYMEWPKAAIFTKRFNLKMFVR